jgi:hypothetical protein
MQSPSWENTFTKWKVEDCNPHLLMVKGHRFLSNMNVGLLDGTLHKFLNGNYFLI